MDELIAKKKQVRERMLAARLSLGEGERADKSEAICSGIERIPEYVRARSVLFYMPIKGEADILPLLKKALGEGRRCLLPKCAENRSLLLFSIADLSCDIAPGTWGIPEPLEGRAREYTGGAISVIMVPGVAFDMRGYRIGYGAGYYDRLLALYGIDTIKIAPAYAFQTLPELPQGPLDGRVDVIATDEGIIDCRYSGGGSHG